MPTVTLLQLKTEVLDRLDNALLYQPQEAVDEINDALRVVSLFTGLIQTSKQIIGFSVPNQYLYNTPDGILIPTAVFFEGKQLQKLSLRKISITYRGWLRDTTASGWPVQNWVPLGLSQFAIHPADARGGQDIRVKGIAEPVPLVQDTDTITVNDEYAEMIVELAAHVLTIKEGGKIFADSTKIFQKWQSKMKEATRWESLVMPRWFVRPMEKRVAKDVEGA